MTNEQYAEMDKRYRSKAAFGVDPQCSIDYLGESQTTKKGPTPKEFAYKASDEFYFSEYSPKEYFIEDDYEAGYDY